MPAIAPSSIEEPDYHAAATYSGLQVLGAAVTATKSLDQTKLRDWLRHNEVETVQGTFASDANGLSQKFGQYLFQINGGTRKLIWPAADAEATVELPYTGK